MSPSIFQLLLVLLLVLLLFGAGKLPKVMSELGRGLKSFKSSMNGNDDKGDPSDKDKS